MAHIVPIVEGPGDAEAVPALLRRVLSERLQRYDITVGSPKVARGKPNLISRLDSFLRYAVIDGAQSMMVVVDADTDCPKELAFRLTEKVLRSRLLAPVAIVCPKPEYETWLIAGLAKNYGQRIRQILDLDASVTSPEDVEKLRDAKGWFTRHMPPTLAYKPTQDQARLTFHISLEVVYTRSRSFRRLCHALEQLVGALDEGIKLVSPPEPRANRD